MTNSNDNTHVYHREITQQERTSLSVVASLVSPRSQVLDLGTGSGALGQHLTSHLGCEVDGVTYNAQEAALAQPWYRRVEIADLEHCALQEIFAAQRYDFIVCADVLEHIKSPERVVEACQKLLKPDGRLIISIPNAAYCGLVGELLSGEFKYREEGLLDQTHLRFFTRRSLLRFLTDCGWTLESLDTVTRELNQSEFQHAFDSLPPAVARYLLATPDALTYQFVVAASPADRAHTRDLAEPLHTTLATSNAPAHAMFSAQLFLGEHGHYAENRKLVCSGVIGQLNQTLTFMLPRSGPEITSLRFDPADRPGFLHLYSLCLRNAHGLPLWQWRSDAEGLAALQKTRHHEVLLRPPWSASPAALMLLHGDDPWFELPIPAAVLAVSGAVLGGTLEVEMGWPMSADYLALAETVNPLQNQISVLETTFARERSELEGQFARERAQVENWLAEERHEKTRLVALERSERERLVALERTEQERLRELARSQSTQLQAQHRSQLDRMRAELQHITQHNATLLEEKTSLTQQTQTLAAQNAQGEIDISSLKNHLAWIENSTIFRATRPLVNAKLWVGRLLRSASAPAIPQAAQQPASNPRAPGTTHPIDVIVPVYKGLDDTRRCIESVLAHACKTPFRLIVINDASPEPEVTAWLREAQSRDARIVLLENPENLGFVGTVNRGMALSETHDVVLLNSDAEVANDWLDRLCHAAYTEYRVATVTPFSNNATICSYPRFCEANLLPAGYDTAAMDALFAQANPGQVVDVPTGIGFCMYIRRDCLSEVGLFDVANFGKGYGEENDFCCRAAAAGWRNLHALDTFVLHAGGVSFGASKSAREQAAMDTLRRLHPNYEREVHQFIAVDPASQARQRVDLARIQTSTLPVVLTVLHDREGGTLRHVHELARHLRHQALFLSLTPTAGGNLSLRLLGDSEALELCFNASTEFDALVQVLINLGIQHVHFHHLIGHSTEILELPARLNTAYDFTAHDYYTFCPQISLTDHTNAYCGEQGLEQCKSCLRRSPAPGGMDIEAWRDRHSPLLAHARYVLTPSVDTARRFAARFPAATVHAVQHTDIADTTVLPVPRPPSMEAGASLKIAVIGAMSAIKGADVLEDVAAAAAAKGLSLDFHLLGYAYRNLRTRPGANLTVHGRYTEADLPQLLAVLKPDLVWFPAQWPETYSYTLSAALQSGLPIVAPDLGAFAERLSQRDWTWVQPWNTPVSEWLDFFKTLHTQHFVPGLAPSKPQPMAVQLQEATNANNADITNHAKVWSYATDYLAGITLKTRQPTSANVHFMGHHPLRSAGTTNGQQGAKQTLLLAVIRLRSAPGLRRVARAIPLRWQTRLKSWLRA